MAVDIPDTRTGFANSVIETLESSGLDLSQCIVHGGSVLALLGLRNTADLDVFLRPIYFKEILMAGQTPGGESIVEKDTIRGRSAFVSRYEPKTGLLPIDAGTYSHRGMNSRFDYHLQLAQRVECALGIINIISPAELKKYKQHGRAIDKSDCNLLEGFLQRQERQPAIGRWAMETSGQRP